jgi:hypothetical protein
MKMIALNLCLLVLVATCCGRESADDDGVNVVIDAPLSKAPIPPTRGSRERRAFGCGIRSAFTREEKKAIVTGHNKFRAQAPSAAMLKMSWDERLAARAQEWSSRCRWYPGMKIDCNGHSVGQNMWMAGHVTNQYKVRIDGVLNSWNKQKQWWNNGTCEPGKSCRYYTQMVWPSTNRVGCGYSFCPTVTWLKKTTHNNVIVVCDYSPPGNIRGATVYPVGEACSECWKITRKDAANPGYICKSGHFCEPCNPATDSNCQCGTPEKCLNGGVWSDKDCRCHCVKSYYGDACENCSDVSSDCNFYRLIFYCKQSSNMYKKMEELCAKTCGFC